MAVPEDALRSLGGPGNQKTHRDHGCVWSGRFPQGEGEAAPDDRAESSEQRGFVVSGKPVGAWEAFGGNPFLLHSFFGALIICQVPYLCH